MSSKEESKENIFILSSQTNHQFHSSDIENVLLDFETLDFANNPCEDDLDPINYNEGKKADPFDKIAKYYGRKGDVFLFIHVVTEKKKEIMDIVSKRCNDLARERFMKRMDIYSIRIQQGMGDAKEFLNSDLPAFFHGYYVECLGHNRNIHENLNIDITKPVQKLQTSSFFSKKTKRIEEEKSEVKRVKIYSNGKKIITIEKKNKQRNYSFGKSANCNIEISWGLNYNCVAILNVNSGQKSIVKSTINGKDVKPKEVLDLVKQNEDVLIGGKVLHEVLGGFLKQAPCEEKQCEKMVTSGTDVPNS